MYNLHSAKLMPLKSSIIFWPQRVVYISHVSFKDVHCGLIVINVPFCHEYFEKGAIAPCTPVPPSVPSMGKQFTSLPLLAFLCVLKACICCRVCVPFHTFLSFALTHRCCLAPLVHRMMSWFLCVNGNCI